MSDRTYLRVTRTTPALRAERRRHARMALVVGVGAVVWLMVAVVLLAAGAMVGALLASIAMAVMFGLCTAHVDLARSIDGELRARGLR